MNNFHQQIELIDQVSADKIKVFIDGLSNFFSGKNCLMNN